MLLRSLSALMLAVCALAVPATATAQVSRVGETTVLIAAAARGSAVAYDSVNDRYLVVSSHGVLWGRLVDGSGAPIGGQFQIGGTVHAHFPRVAFSPDANGGAGAFLVVWHESDTSPTSIHTRLVSSTGALLTADTQLVPATSFWEVGAAVSYSTVSKEFLVAWRTFSPATIRGIRVSNSATALGASFPIAAYHEYADNPNIAYNPSADEWLVVHSGYNVSYAYVSAQRVKPGTGALLGGPNPFGQASAVYITDVAYNPSTNQYLAAWHTGTMRGQVLNADGSPTGSVIPLSNRYAAYDALSLARNPLSNTYFAVSHDSAGTQDGGVEIGPNGQPLTSGVQVTSIGGTGNFYPRLAPSTARPDWYVSAANVFTSTVGQRITTATVASGGGPVPPPNPCAGSLGSSSASFNYLGGGGGVTLTIGSTCSWTATSSDTSWLTVGSGSASGTGGKLITFSVGANPLAIGRAATLNIGGQTYTVSQSGVPCTFDVTPTSISIASAAADGTVQVTTPAACSWSTSSQSPLLAFNGTPSRTGSGGVSFSIGPNFSTNGRSGSGMIAGRLFSVTQAGAPSDAGIRARERARADFNGDGYSDILWQDNVNGYLAAWAMAGDHTQKTALGLSHSIADSNWRMVATGDFNGDGKPDIVWHHRLTGALYLWFMNGVNRIGHSAFSIAGLSDARWRVVGSGDFNQDGHPDLVWQHDTGWLGVWLFNGTTFLGGFDMSPGQVNPQWRIAGVADLNADGKSDLLWRNSATGELGAWLMNGVTRTEYIPLDPAIVDLEWRIAAIIDINGDQTPDIVWQHDQAGWVAVWYMNGMRRIGAGSFPVAVETNWKIAGPK